MFVSHSHQETPTSNDKWVDSSNGMWLDNDMSTKDTAAHLRNRISVAGITNARVRMAPGSKLVIQVFPAGGCDAEFTADEQVTIATIAEVNGLTLTHGLPIVVGQGTNGHGFRFQMPRQDRRAA